MLLAAPEGFWHAAGELGSGEDSFGYGKQCTRSFFLWWHYSWWWWWWCTFICHCSGLQWNWSHSNQKYFTKPSRWGRQVRIGSDGKKKQWKNTQHARGEKKTVLQPGDQFEDTKKNTSAHKEDKSSQSCHRGHMTSNGGGWGETATSGPAARVQHETRRFALWPWQEISSWRRLELGRECMCVCCQCRWLHVCAYVLYQTGSLQVAWKEGQRVLTTVLFNKCNFIYSGICSGISCTAHFFLYYPFTVVVQFMVLLLLLLLFTVLL